MRKEKDLSDNLFAPGPGQPAGDFARKITEKISRQIEEERFGKELPLKRKKGGEMSDKLFAPGPDKKPGDFAKKIVNKISEEMERKEKIEEKLDYLRKEMKMIMLTLAGKNEEGFELAKERVHEYLSVKFNGGEPLSVLWLIDESLDNYLIIKKGLMKNNPNDPLIKKIDEKIEFLKKEKDFFVRRMNDE